MLFFSYFLVHRCTKIKHRSSKKWVQNLEIPGTDTEGHFRRRITWKKSTEDQPMERGGEKPVDYDDHLLRRKKAIEEAGDVYNHIHFQKFQRYRIVPIKA